jgi:sugar lactone lactonase YvrE
VAQAEQIPGTECYHGEGPCWADEWGGLRWVDMLSGDVLSLDQHGGVTRTHVGEVAAVIRPRASGGAVLALADSFAVTDGDLGQLRTVATVSLEPGVRLNEGGCDPDGRFYCGSMATDESPQAGTFYCLDPDGSVRPVLDKVTISNGFDFSPDGTIAYYVDTRDQSIDIFDYSADTGLVNRRRADPPSIIIRLPAAWRRSSRCRYPRSPPARSVEPAWTRSTSPPHRSEPISRRNRPQGRCLRSSPAPVAAPPSRSRAELLNCNP